MFATHNFIKIRKAHGRGTPAVKETCSNGNLDIAARRGRGAPQKIGGPDALPARSKGNCAAGSERCGQGIKTASELSRGMM